MSGDEQLKIRLEIKIGQGAYIFLPPLHITIIAVIIIIFLVKWSKQLETRRFTILFYFLISTYISPIYSQSTKEGSFQLWIPTGFFVNSLLHIHQRKKTSI